MQYIELDLSENKKLGKNSCSEVPIGRTVYYIHLVVGDLVCQDLGRRLELRRNNWDKAHGQGRKLIVFLALSTRQIGERCILTLGGVL